MKPAYLPNLTIGLVLLCSLAHFCVEMTPTKIEKKADSDDDEKMEEQSVEQPVEQPAEQPVEQTEADPNIATSSSGDPLVQQIEMSQSQGYTKPKTLPEKEEELALLIEQMKALKFDIKEHKEKLKETEAPLKAIERVAKQKARSKAVTEKNKAFREESIDVVVNVVNEDGSRARLLIRIQRGKSTGKLKDAVLLMLGKTLKRGTTISITWQGREIYNIGVNQKGLKRLNILGVNSMDELTMTIGNQPQLNVEKTEAEELAIPLGHQSGEENEETESETEEYDEEL